MSDPVLTVVMLLVWGTVVALDLVSVPQVMIARPLVAGTVAGWIAGDFASGFRLAVVMELFALDVLPVGAARYPDYGPATVGGAVLVAHRGSWEESLGLAVALALVVASLGGWTLGRLRHRIGRAVQRSAPDLEAGDVRSIGRLQLGSIMLDASRGLLLTAVALMLVFLTERYVALDAGTGALLSVIAVGSGIAAVTGGALRSAGRGPRLRWLVGGGVLGLLLVWLA
ncbi:MAG TPA: PTS sugar transporter subunit IIC [Gemmatimonadales bacterium]|nr:PTS sugar transporter subunit IIC [Gemmatimonadales bacterium]